MTVFLCKRRGTPALDRRKLERRAQKLLRELGLADSELSVLLCRDEEIQTLNREYRHLDKPTDVLSFSQREGASGAPQTELLGDVVISLPTARRQAEARGHGLMAEVLDLLVHGVLHLTGHEHVGTTRKRAAAMRREQARLLALLLPAGHK